MAGEARTVVEARELRKDYDTGGSVQHALAGVSLSVPARRFVSVMGPSGSGKSTLLHLLGGLDRPTAGEVVFEGRGLSGLPERELTLIRRHRIGFVFQAYNLVPVLSARDNIALPAVIAGEAPAAYRERLDEALERVGLAEHQDKLPSQLSGGEQQRVALARALFMGPVLVLADEPTGNLDTRTGAEVLSLLRRARADLDTTVVMVTHDPRAAATGDEVLMLRDGALAGRLELGVPGAASGDSEDRSQTVLRWLQDLDGAAAGPAASPSGPRPTEAGR